MSFSTPDNCVKSPQVGYCCIFYFDDYLRVYFHLWMVAFFSPSQGRLSALCNRYRVNKYWLAMEKTVESG